jgi:hypothetical protein
MAKRLRDVCALPLSEPLWRAGRGAFNVGTNVLTAFISLPVFQF